MEKRRTISIMILGLVLAALVAAAAVLGVGLARYDTVVGSDAAVGEARWSVKDEKHEATVGTGNLRPDYVKYVGTRRTKDWFGCVAILTNDGDVGAKVSMDGESQASPDFDVCGSVDHNRYGASDVDDHIKVSGLYYSTTSDATSSSGLGSLTDVSIGVNESVYIYASVTWYTDLERDMGNENQPYDGTFGDEFDTWAGTHLLGVTFTVTLRYEQAS